MTHIPTRTCVACRSQRPRHELVRIVRGPDGIALDVRARRPGRGAWVCPEPACIDVAGRDDARSLRRALRGGDPHEATAALSMIER